MMVCAAVSLPDGLVAWLSRAAGPAVDGLAEEGRGLANVNTE